MRRALVTASMLALALPQAAFAKGEFDPSEEFEQHAWVSIHIGSLDLSITKAVAYLMLGSVLTMLIGVTLMRARAGRAQALGEQIYEVAQTQVAEQGLPSKGIARWFPYVATLQAKLSQDKSIDAIVTLGAPQAIDAIKAMDAAGSKAKLATFDLNQEAATDIQSGKIEFSIDQQPYVQGYMSVTSLYLYIKNGNDIGGGKAVLTGPSFVDKSNIDKIVPFTKNNTR